MPAAIPSGDVGRIKGKLSHLAQRRVERCRRSHLGAKLLQRARYELHRALDLGADYIRGVEVAGSEERGQHRLELIVAAPHDCGQAGDQLGVRLVFAHEIAD